MATTVSQSESNFKIDVVENQDGSSTISRNNNQKFNGTELKLDEEGGVNAVITSDQKTTLKLSTLTTSSEDDFLVIEGKTRGSKVKSSKSDDEVAFDPNNDENFIVVDSTINLGKGNDTATFNGSVKGSVINPGEGEDTLIFGGDVINTTIKLGNDGNIDSITLDPDADITGLRIEGADEGDLLIIGDKTYTYDEQQQGWFNGNDEFKF